MYATETTKPASRRANKTTLPSTWLPASKIDFGISRRPTGSLKQLATTLGLLAGVPLAVYAGGVVCLAVMLAVTIAAPLFLLAVAVLAWRAEQAGAGSFGSQAVSAAS